MAGELPPPQFNPGRTDPSLLGGQTQIGIDDPIIRALARDPESITGPERDAAVIEAQRLAAGPGNRVILTDKEGNPRWGKDYSKVFTFDGQIRGQFEEVPKDTADQPVAMQLAFSEETMRGKQSHVIFETDDGQKILVRRTNDRVSASRQTFELLVISQEVDGARKLQRRELDTNMLKGVVVVPGEPLTLGIDPQTGRHIRTRGKITSITAVDMTDAGIIDPSHSSLTKRPEMRRDALENFNNALRETQQRKVAPEVGSTVVENMPLVVEPQSELVGSDEQIAEATSSRHDQDKARAEALFSAENGSQSRMVERVFRDIIDSPDAQRLRESIAVVGAAEPLTDEAKAEMSAMRYLAEELGLEVGNWNRQNGATSAVERVAVFGTHNLEDLPAMPKKVGSTYACEGREITQAEADQIAAARYWAESADLFSNSPGMGSRLVASIHKMAADGTMVVNIEAGKSSAKLGMMRRTADLLGYDLGEFSPVTNADGSKTYRAEIVGVDKRVAEFDKVRAFDEGRRVRFGADTVIAEGRSVADMRKVRATTAAQTRGLSNRLNAGPQAGETPLTSEQKDQLRAQIKTMTGVVSFQDRVIRELGRRAGSATG